MCDKAADCLAALNFTSKMIKIFFIAFTDENILYFNEDSGNVTLLVMEWIFLI